MNSTPPRIPPSLAPRDEPIDVLLDDEPEPEPHASRPRRRWRWLLWTFLVLFALFLTPPAVVLALRWLPPPTTAFMIQSPVKPVKYAWVPAARIPETLREGAVAAEDQKFFTHWGFDFMAIAEALEHNEKSKRRRGASTITQQVAKNLFLWPSRSYLRKGLEVTFTLLIELCWSKDRILEVYLNVAEFGPGVFGVQAAAREFFEKDAADLTPLETSRLVAVLPNPRKWNARQPGPYVQKRVDWIMVQIGHGPPAAVMPEGEPLPSEGIPMEPGLEALEPLDSIEPFEPGTEEPIEPDIEGGMQPPPEGAAPQDPAVPPGGNAPAPTGAPAGETPAPEASPPPN